MVPLVLATCRLPLAVNHNHITATAAAATPVDLQEEVRRVGMAVRQRAVLGAADSVAAVALVIILIMATYPPAVAVGTAAVAAPVVAIIMVVAAAGRSSRMAFPAPIPASTRETGLSLSR